MDVVAADVEEMDVFAGVGRVGSFFGVLREVRQGEGLEAFGGVAEDVAWALLGGFGVALLNGGERGGFCCGGLGVARRVRRCGSTKGRAGMVGAKGRAVGLMLVMDFVEGFDFEVGMSCVLSLLCEGNRAETTDAGGRHASLQNRIEGRIS